MSNPEKNPLRRARRSLAALTGAETPSHVMHSSGERTYEGIPRMPAMFGRQVGPRQRPDRNEGYPVNAGDTLATWVAMEADGERLAALLPDGFGLTEPLLIVEAISLTNLPWLAGRGYEMLLVSVPVIYRASGLEHSGRLELVTWEDRPDAIISGREELGWNKLYADTMTRHSGDDGKSVRYIAAWGGTTFFEMEARLSRKPAAASPWRKGPLMHYRVLPRTERWGELEVEQVTGSTGGPPLGAIRSLQSGTGRFAFKKASFEQLPTLQHITNRLAAIELGDVVDAGQAQSASWDALHNMKVLDSKTPQKFVPDEQEVGS